MAFTRSDTLARVAAGMVSARVEAEGREDDEAAFSAFFVASVQRVAGIVAVALGREDVVEDVVQEAFLRAHARWRRVRGLERPDLWVVRVAVNLGRDADRRRRREAEHIRSQGPRLAAGTETADRIRALWLEWGLAQLPPMQRAVVILHHLEDREIEDVARALARSRETVRTHLKLARRRLRLLLEDSL